MSKLGTLTKVALIGLLLVGVAGCSSHSSGSAKLGGIGGGGGGGCADVSLKSSTDTEQTPVKPVPVCSTARYEGAWARVNKISWKTTDTSDALNPRRTTVLVDITLGMDKTYELPDTNSTPTPQDLAFNLLPIEVNAGSDYSICDAYPKVERLAPGRSIDAQLCFEHSGPPSLLKTPRIFIEAGGSLGGDNVEIVVPPASH